MQGQVKQSPDTCPRGKLHSWRKKQVFCGLKSKPPLQGSLSSNQVFSQVQCLIQSQESRWIPPYGPQQSFTVSASTVLALTSPPEVSIVLNSRVYGTQTSASPLFSGMFLLYKDTKWFLKRRLFVAGFCSYEGAGFGEQRRESYVFVLPYDCSARE